MLQSHPPFNPKLPSWLQRSYLAIFFSSVDSFFCTHSSSTPYFHRTPKSSAPSPLTFFPLSKPYSEHKWITSSELKRPFQYLLSLTHFWQSIALNSKNKQLNTISPKMISSFRGTIKFIVLQDCKLKMLLHLISLIQYYTTPFPSLHSSI